MLINRLTEDGNGTSKEEKTNEAVEDHLVLSEYQTASELFDLMAKDHNFSTDEDETLTTQDFVLIYKNIDLGTKLMSKANEMKGQKANQYVETIVYDELDSDSDLSEMCSTEDIHNVMMINKEQIDLLTNTSSFDKGVSFSSKCSNLENPTNIGFSCDRKIFFKNSEINVQLDALKLTMQCNNSNEAIFPSISLLDYVCCEQRLDNHYFYMDNIIRYVKHTIEQLKRISNGDYLTEKAKEKWKENDNKNKKYEGSDIAKTKALVNTTSIPLYVDQKIFRRTTKWNELVYSPLNIGSIPNILDKKIVVKVPKTLCTSYKLMSECCNDNVIIRCRNPATVQEESTKESRLKVVLEFIRSQSRQNVNVIGNTNSVLVLQTTDKRNNVLPLPYRINNLTIKNDHEEKVQITEIQDDHERFFESDKVLDHDESLNEQYDSTYTDVCNDDSVFQSSCEFSETDSKPNQSCDGDSKKPITTFDELQTTIQKINQLKVFPEESIDGSVSSRPSSYNKKRRSPIQNRIKSPYENKSHLIEEKKRRRLLEIKQRREKKKLALSIENCKEKNKYKPFPATTNSMTQLSITNKSFYENIYGISSNSELNSKINKVKTRKERKDVVQEGSFTEKDAPTSSDQDDFRMLKYINKSYYLDNAVTEVMCMEMKNDEDQTSRTAESSEVNLNLLTNFIAPVLSEKEACKSFSGPKAEENVHLNSTKEKNVLISPQLPNISQTSQENMDEKDKKASTSAEFKKNIDKIYDLIHKLGKSEGNETKLSKSKFTAVADCGFGIIGSSESGTSLKHRLNSSTTSNLSFDKRSYFDEQEPLQFPDTLEINKKKSTNIQKVIINAKPQAPNPDGEKLKKERKKISLPQKPNTENPLKAISQLLHEFDTVQKSRSKIITDKTARKSEVTFADLKVDQKELARKQSKSNNSHEQRTEQQNRVALKDRRYKAPLTIPPVNENKAGPKLLKKLFKEKADEIKEARGEAIRGPSKLNAARLNSLAQPKKSYVQAQIEDFQAKYGRNVFSDRLQKISGITSSPVSSVAESPIRAASPKFRKRKDSAEPESPSSRQAPSPALEKLQKKPSNRTFRHSEASLNSYKEPKSNRTLQKKVDSIKYPKKNGELLPMLDDNGFICGGAQKLRVPLIPRDISLISGEDLFRKGLNKIDRMAPPLLKKQASATHSNINTNAQNNSKNIEQRSKRTPPKEQSDIKNHVCNTQQHKCEYVINATIPEENDSLSSLENDNVPIQEPPDKSTTQLEKLEQALCERLTVGNFHKRLRLKKITISPKESNHQMVLLQSGDTNSLILRSTISQNLNTKDIPHLKTIKDLTSLDWKFSQFPVQIPLVGYSFTSCPHSRSTQVTNLLSDIHVESGTLTNQELSIESFDSCTNLSDKVIQCYKGGLVDKLGTAVQVDVKDLFIAPNVVVTGIGNDCMNITKEGKSEGDTGSLQGLNRNKAMNDVNELNGASIIKESCRAQSREAKSVKFDDELSIIEEENKVRYVEIKDIGSEDIIKKENPLNTFHVPVPSDMESTTSLDVLVSLLNEIQKITTCQSQIANNERNSSIDVDKYDDFENIYRSAACEHLDEKRSIISITSLDKLRQLSNSSLCSFYLSSMHETLDTGFKNHNIQNSDKEVNVKFSKEFVNQCTDVPSRFLPITVTKSTNISDVSIGPLSKPSSIALFSTSEYTLLHRAASLTSFNKVIELPMEIKKHQIYAPCVLNRPTQIVKQETKIKKHRDMVSVAYKNADLAGLIICKNNVNAIDSFDSVKKIKRDILVTVYSVLVITVFAALSFPEILYRA